jgi:magnesium chelatase family protein
MRVMLAEVLTATPWGIDARPVRVEVDVHPGLPGIQIVGLPDAAVKESRQRVRSAIKNCGFELPPRAVVVNLAPADLRKEGNHLDLPIALALLVAYGHLPQEALAGRLVSGELGLDGSVRSVRGGLAVADLAAREGARELLVPAANAGEAAALGAPPVVGVATLAAAADHLTGRAPLPAAATAAFAPEPPGGGAPDLAEVRGQEGAKRALEVAAAGGHNLLFVGPPGSGKTMLARRMSGLLPPLTREEALAVSKIHSLAAERPAAGLVGVRPFRSPHSGISTVAMVGGGPLPRPGEVTLAHHGVLFLDELPEFRRDTLEALRQPLEEGRIEVVRARARLAMPARFSLLAAMNPCPCGHLGDRRHDCRCPPPLVERYRGRVSGPLLDRIDLHVEVPAVTLADLRRGPGEPTAAVAARVAAARARQLGRYGGEGPSPVNATLGPEGLRRHCALDAAGQALLDAAFERLALSARAVHRILKVARTLADLAGCDRLGAAHVAEAVQYRMLDRRVLG